MRLILTFLMQNLRVLKKETKRCTTAWKKHREIGYCFIPAIINKVLTVLGITKHFPLHHSTYTNRERYVIDVDEQNLCGGSMRRKGRGSEILNFLNVKFETRSVAG